MRLDVNKMNPDIQTVLKLTKEMKTKRYSKALLNVNTNPWYGLGSQDSKASWCIPWVVQLPLLDVQDLRQRHGQCHGYDVKVTRCVR